MARKTIGYVHLEWVCPNCNVKNSGTDQLCKSCGCPQPADINFQLGDKEQIIEDEKLIAQAKAGADVHCPYCGARNKSDTKVCIQCGGDLVQGLKRKTGAKLGSFSEEPAHQTICANCNTPNPVSNRTCLNCGAPMMTAPASPVSSTMPSVSKKKTNPIIRILLILAGLFICIALATSVLSKTKTEDITGIVDSVYWKRTLDIEQLSPVEKKDWRDQIPQDSEIISCSKEYHHTQDEPAKDSEEVCGTPYVVDTGSGVGEKVIDCEYKVYLDYCSYNGLDWKVIDTSIATGNDHNAVWPEPSLNEQQRLGASSETYVCRFSTSNGTSEFQTSNFEKFNLCKIGSKLTLSVNGAGKITDISD